MSDIHDEFKNLKESLGDTNTDRGGGTAQLAGFYGEEIAALNDNLQRKEKGIAARVVVIDNNGDADAIIVYADGRKGRQIQYKIGYTFSQHKSFLSSGQYDGMIYEINYDNPIFDDPQKMDELKKIAAEHNIKISRAKVSKEEMTKLAKRSINEGNIRSFFGLPKNAPLVTSLYTVKPKADHYIDRQKKKLVEINNYIQENTAKFISEDFSKINNAGISEGVSAALYAAIFSTADNLVKVVKEEKDISDGTKAVVKDASAAFALGYAKGAISEAIGLSTDGSDVIVTGTIQISKQIFAYIDGTIDEEQLVDNIEETSMKIAAQYIGKMMGGAVGSLAGPVGTLIGQYIGEVITTTVCADVISTVRLSKDFDKYNNKVISMYHRAESEIRYSQGRLQLLINKENDELLNAINCGMNMIAEGIRTDSYSKIEEGLCTISSKFGLGEEELKKDIITKDNLFSNKNEVIII